MEIASKIVILILLAAVAVFAYRKWLANYKPRQVYPRGQRKYVTDPYLEKNAAAALLSEVLALKDRSAQWPEILKTLNPQDDPRVRTVLFELRGPHVFVPHTALNIIESVCLASSKSSASPSRLDLLEASRQSMQRVTQFGS